MKGLLVLLCAFAAAQARSTGTHETRALAVLGENPWIVHLRLAVSTGGHLETCAGSVIGHEWVLTAFSCIRHHRFIWLRYGLVEDIRPALVMETNVVRSHPNLDLALIHVNRHVEFSDNIAPVQIAQSDAEVPASGKFCGFGATENGTPGRSLACFAVNVDAQEDGLLLGQSDEGETTTFDVGAPLVDENGVQFGVLVRSGEQSVFINPAVARDWIETTTGINLGGEDESEEGDNGEESEEGDNGEESEESDNGEDSSESSSESSSSDDSSSDDSSSEEAARMVHFVN